MNNSNEHCVEEVRPYYESEHYRQEELIKKLYNENKELRDTIIGMCKTLFMKGGVE